MGCDIHMVVERYGYDYDLKVNRWKMVISSDGTYSLFCPR